MTDTGKGWVRKYDYSWLERLAVNVIKVGRVPNHIAVIMDGNRRFARQAGDPVLTGHRAGFDKLAETLQWCRELGVREVTVYAFSIENFNRTETEVSDLLNLARDKFHVLLGETEKLREAGVRVRIIGNLTYLPDDLRDVIRQVETATASNDQSLLNIALSYTAREEITHAVREVAARVASGHIEAEEVNEETLERFLYTGQSEKPELLIRTSGETRLSDFMLWQASSSITYFSPVLWPEFSLWQLLAGIFFFQRQHSRLQQVLHSPATSPVQEKWAKLEQRNQVADILHTWQWQCST